MYVDIYNKKYFNNPKYLNILSFSQNYKLYFKFTNKNEFHRGFQYKDGFNIDTKIFKPSNTSCSGGGLYFCDIDHLWKFYNFGINIRPILIPKDIPFIREQFGGDASYIKYKARIIYCLPYFRLGTTLSMKLVHNTNDKNIKCFENYLWLNNSIDELQKYINNTNNTTLKYKTYARFKILLIKFNNILNDNNNIDIKEFYDLCDIIEHKTNDFPHFDNILEEFLYNNDNSIIKFLYLYFKNLISKTKKYIKHNINNNRQEHIISSLKNIIFNNTNLYNYLKNNNLLNNCYISGSYPLKFLLNLDYTANDIDIYIEYNPEIYNYLIHNSELKNFITKQKQHYGCDIKNIIKKMVNITIDNINIQFIFTNIYPVEFIKKSFDFDFCTCCYDIFSDQFIYDTKYNYYEGYIQELYIKDMTLENTFTNYRAVETIGRCIKYINRGFIINNINEFLDHVKKICFYEYN